MNTAATIVTSSPKGLIHDSWKGRCVMNIVNDGEVGDVKASKDAVRLFPGKYGPPLGEMLRHVSQHEQSTIMLVNSDIILALHEANIPADGQGGLAFIRRIDLPMGIVNPWGVDVFIFGKTFLDALRRTTGWEAFQFGAPWWDYVLPIAALQMGVHLWRIESPVAFHQEHEQRWSNRDMAVGATAARNYLESIGFRSPSAGPSSANDFARVCHNEFMTKATTMSILNTPMADLAWRYAADDRRAVEHPTVQPPWPKRLERKLRPYVKAALGRSSTLGAK